MKKSGKYDTSGLLEDQYEPGSRRKVLKNLHGIKSKKDLERFETQELLRLAATVPDWYATDHVFSAEDICSMHRQWLSGLYEWAGKYRQVLISKGGFSFAAPAFIPRLMADFEKNILQRYTPCVFTELDKKIEALAVVHTELLLIHPFREGNGRIARLLAACMGFQAGLPFLDFSDIEGKKREKYFAAVRVGLDRDYKPMEKVFSEVVSRSLRDEEAR